MKKISIIAILCLFLAVGLFASRNRAYTQAVSDPNSVLPLLQFPDVTVGSTSTQPGYIVNVWVTTRPTEVLSTLTHPATQVRLFRFGNGTTVPYNTRVVANFGNWATDWTGGETVRVQIINNNVTPSMTDYWDLVIPDNATSALTITTQIPMNLWPVASDETLTITSTPTGQPIWVNGAPTGEVTPADFDNPTAGDIYTINNAMYNWAPLNYTVPADFVTATVDFTGTEIDTYTYKLNVIAPGAYAVTHANPLNAGTTNYQVVANNEAALLGMYEIADAPEGFYWEVNPIEVLAGGWADMTGGKAPVGSRSNGAKVNYIYEKDIEFVLVAVPVTDVIIDEDGVVVTAPVGTTIILDVPIPAQLVGVDTGIPAVTYQITTTGVRDVTVTRPAGYPVSWWAWLLVGGNLIEAANPIMTDTYTFVGVDFDAKGDVVVILDDNETLPVVLSSFTAVLTAQNYVQLNWITESETNMLGFRVYRSETSEMSDAVLITPVMIGATNTSSTQHYSVTDNEVLVGTTYNYWLETVDMGHSNFHGPQAVTVTGNSTPTLPSITQLGNAYPNPFRASTNISLAVKEGETANITIYNILGQVVRTYTKTQGSHTINWDGRDARGNACGSGIYFYKLSSPSMNQTKKMVIVK